MSGSAERELPMEWSSGSLSCNCRRSPERVIWRRRRRGFARWCRGRAKTCPAMDLVVFPEYSLHGLSTDTNAELMSRLDGPEVASFRQACIDTASGLFLHHGIQSPRQPVQFRPHHRRRRRYQVYYREMHPWVLVEPWEPRNIGITGSKVALIISPTSARPAQTVCSIRWAKA